MVVNYLHIVGILFLPAEADAPLVVDPDAELSPAVALQRFETVATRYTQHLETSSRINQLELASRRCLNLSRQPPNFDALEYGGGMLVGEASDPVLILPQANSIGKRY